MIFAVLGIYDYFQYTNDTDAKLLFDKGVNSIKREISKYNYNGYSYYDLLGNPANKYHQIHIDLTKQLYDLTGESIFTKYHELWKYHNNLSLLNYFTIYHRTTIKNMFNICNFINFYC